MPYRFRRTFFSLPFLHDEFNFLRKDDYGIVSMFEYADACCKCKAVLRLIAVRTPKKYYI